MDLVIPAINWASIAPELVVFITALVVLLLGAFFPRISGGLIAGTSLVGVLAAFLVTASLWGRSELAFTNMLALDNYGLFFNVIFLICAALTILASMGYFAKFTETVEHAEYYSLLLFSCVGMMFMAAGTDLITIFLGLETMSIAIYILAGFVRKDVKGNESALKYLLLGAFSTGFLLYGIALIFGATGSTNLVAIYKYLSGADPSVPMLLFGMGFLIVGFGFKVASVPFHMWTPDVYEGAPTVVTGFMAAGVKAAAFAAFLRVFVYALPSLQPNWTAILWALAILTMTIGNLAALLQENIKRMLAYSSIAHAGYLLLGVAALSTAGQAAVLYYLAGYLFTVLGAFTVICLVMREIQAEDISGLAGLNQRSPLLASTMTLAMVSLAGLPPMAGFFGKFLLLKSVIEQGGSQPGYYCLAFVAIAGVVISFYYYFGVIRAIYWSRHPADLSPIPVSKPLRVALYACIAGMFYLGMFPGALVNLTQQAVQVLK